MLSIRVCVPQCHPEMEPVTGGIYLSTAPVMALWACKRSVRGAVAEESDDQPLCQQEQR